jgi:hypothetical protein
MTYHFTQPLKALGESIVRLKEKLLLAIWLTFLRQLIMGVGRG